MSLEVVLLTPAGTGAVAVVSVRGSGAAARLADLAGALPAVGAARLARLAGGEAWLDEALVVRRGEEDFELGLHGGPSTVEAVLAALGGATSAPAGVEGRALDALARAPCDRAARVLLDQAEGTLRAAVEAQRTVAEPAPWLPVWRRHARLLVPATVVLAGPVNAGKSTLFNLLVGEERVAVTPEPGTTRDAIVGRAHLGPYAVDVVDTAGERALEGTSEVEAAGQALGRSLRERADLVLWLVPLDAPAAPEGALRTHADRVDSDPARWPADAVSATARPEATLERVHERLRGALGLAGEEPWSPGAAVPPDERTALGLDRALARPPGPERDAALERVLGPPPALKLP